MKRVLFLWFIQLLFIIPCLGENKDLNSLNNNSQVLLINNNQCSDNISKCSLIKEYLDHFGIIYHEVDISNSDNVNFSKYKLLLIVNEKVFYKCSKGIINNFRSSLKYNLNQGIGIVSFTTSLMNDLNSVETNGIIENITFSDVSHYITENHKVDEILKLDTIYNGAFSINSSNKTLLKASGVNLLTYEIFGKGTIVYWTSSFWMEDKYLGRLRGLDDCFLRSMVWSSKKPFFVRGIFPIVTMRIDDVYGTGAKWKKAPFWWVNVLNKYHIRPWLGLFLDSIDHVSSVEQLKAITLIGNCTSNPHSFGRDKFIYFNHDYNRPFDSIKTLSNISLVEKWYEKNSNLLKSTVLIPHFYEIGNKFVEYISQKWNIKYWGLLMGVNVSWYRGNKLQLLPYAYSKKTSTAGASDSFAYSDYYIHDNDTLFDCLNEIRDWGYDWSPGNDINSTVQRGVNIISRGLQSMIVSTLMTHEYDYIKDIEPDNWEKNIQMITESVAKYKPLYLTMDSAMAILKSTEQSKIKSIDYTGSKYKISLIGKTEAPTSLYIYTGDVDNINQDIKFLPAFQDSFVFEYDPNETKTKIFNKVIGGAPKDDFINNNPNSIINDPFYYNPQDSFSQTPIQTDKLNNAKHIFTTKANDYYNWCQIEINIPDGFYLKAIDIWGKNDVTYDGKGCKDLVLTISNDTYSWMSNALDLDTSNILKINYVRVDFEQNNAPCGILATAKTLRIDHSPGNNNELCLAEIYPIIESTDGKDLKLDTSLLKYKSDSICLLPNPITGNTFTVFLPDEDEICDLDFFDTFGRHFYSKNIIGTTIISEKIFPQTGIYYIKVKGKYNRSFFKVLYIK